mmetsp:Transcript_28179/g.45284  ORF Transcript_28179/g.45284 Transcript_28179/m.45284 type:complete len:285 (+) Transcript_28179:210-1064(+)
MNCKAGSDVSSPRPEQDGLYPIVNEDKTIGTLNGMGFQFSCPNVFHDKWVGAFDGEHPVLDIGCAFGINTFPAAEKGIPVIAMDFEREHLKIVKREATNKNVQRFVTVMEGKLPDEISLGDESVSSILLSEVIHFLTGKEMLRAIQNMKRVLVPGGIICITCVEFGEMANGDGPQQAFYRQAYKENEGLDLWPGEIHDLRDRMDKFAASYEGKQDGESTDNMMKIKNTRGDAFPNFLHCHKNELLEEAFINAGFSIEHSTLGCSPGILVEFKSLKEVNMIVKKL